MSESVRSKQIRGNPVKKIVDRPLLIDLTELLFYKKKKRRYTGVQRVTAAYARYVRNRAYVVVSLKNRVLEFSSSDSLHLISDALSPSRGLSLKTRWILLKASIFGTGFSSPKRCILLKTDYYRMWDKNYILYVSQSRIKPLFFLHDLIPVRDSSLYYQEIFEECQQLFKKIFNLGAGIVLSAAETHKEAISYAKQKNYKTPSLLVAPLAPAVLPSPSTIPPFKKPYFVMLGSFHPRKNHLFMLEIWRQIIHKKKGRDIPQLVIIGQKSSYQNYLKQCLHQVESLKDVVSIVWGPPDKDLSTLLSHAQALLFPTINEGFGLPLVEALSQGVPVIANDLPVFREFAKDIPEYIDLKNRDTWVDLIMEYTETRSLIRQAQLQRMATYQAPSWEEHFERLESFMEKI